MDKKFVKVYSKNDGGYWVKSNDIGLENLGEFLRDVDDAESISSTIKNLYDGPYKLGGSNMTIIDQYDDYLEIRTASYDRDEVEFYEDLPCLRISIDEFAHVLREWREFTINSGQEFLLTLNNGKIDIATKINRRQLIPHTLVAKDPNINPFAKIYIKGNTHEVESNDIPLLNLANFISHRNAEEAVFRAIEFAYTNQFDGMYGNNTIARRDDHYICIRARHYDTNVYSEETIPHFRTHRDEFARILREWRDFIEKGIKEFLITLEDGKLAIIVTY